MKNLMSLITLCLGMNLFAVELGEYQNSQGDRLSVRPGALIVLEQTRQYGGPGSLTKEGVVPFETNCRVKTWANVLSEIQDKFTYQVRYAHLVMATDAKYQKNCEIYVAEVNGNVLSGNALIYSESKQGFERVKLD